MKIEKKVTIDGKVYGEGDYISLDGTSGKVYSGEIEAVADPEFSEEFKTLMSWADEIRSLQIRTNADNPRDAAKAVEFGAEGIGLCRTEHMFFEDENPGDQTDDSGRIYRREREVALAKLLPFQKEDFKGIYKVMGENR